MTTFVLIHGAGDVGWYCVVRLWLLKRSGAREIRIADTVAAAVGGTRASARYSQARLRNPVMTDVGSAHWIAQ